MPAPPRRASHCDVRSIERNAMGHAVRFAITLAILVLLPAVSLAAPPVAPVLVAPKGVLEGTTHAFSWRAVAGATSYQLYIRDALVNPKLLETYTAEQVGCPTGEGVCTVIVST